MLRKGVLLDEERLRTLWDLGRDVVYAAKLDPGDVPEDEAAERVARVVGGTGITASRAHTGRVNLSAEHVGVLHVSVEVLLDVNRVDGLTVATLPTFSLVRPGQRVATVKVIPFALPETALTALDAADTPLATVREIPERRATVILVGTEGVRQKLETGIGAAIATRLGAVSAKVERVVFEAPYEDRIARALQDASERSDLVVIAGETAIMDEDDLIPRGIRRAGGHVEHLGLPMDPGHLLLLAYLDDTPVVGAPGCVRGRPPDGFDAVVPRLLTGERMSRDDLLALGHGGLLSDPRGS